MHLLSPLPNGSTAFVMRTLDGREYTVDSPSRARTMARDMQRMAAGYGHLMRDSLTRATADGLQGETEFRAWYASMQAHTGAVYECAAWAGQTYGLNYVPGDAGVTIPPVRVGSRMMPVDNNASLAAAGRALRLDASNALRELASNRTVTIASPDAIEVQNKALPVAATVAIYTIGIVSAAVVVYQLSRTALTWYIPEGRATFESYSAARDAIRNVYAARIERCENMPEGPERTACESAALDAYTEALTEAATDAGRETWQTTALKVAAVGAAAYVLVHYFRSKR
jgi:hypothetical protein